MELGRPRLGHVAGVCAFNELKVPKHGQLPLLRLDGGHTTQRKGQIFHRSCEL